MELKGAREEDLAAASQMTGMFRSGPVWIQVLFFPVRVFPSGLGFNFSGPVRSGLEKNPVRVFTSSPGFMFSRSGPGFIFNIFG